MKIFTVMMGSDENGSVNMSDAIKHEGDLWLVPYWLENQSEQWKTPKLMIRLNKGDYMPLGAPADYLLNYPIPTPVLKGRAQKSEGASFDVLEHPDIKVPIQTSRPSVH